MPNDYEVNVIITEHPAYWAWKMECLGQFVASGAATSVAWALRLARRCSGEDGYSFGRLKLIREYEEHGKRHLIYGADLKEEQQ